LEIIHQGLERIHQGNQNIIELLKKGNAAPSILGSDKFENIKGSLSKMYQEHWRGHITDTDAERQSWIVPIVNNLIPAEEVTKELVGKVTKSLNKYWRDQRCYKKKNFIDKFKQFFPEETPLEDIKRGYHGKIEQIIVATNGGLSPTAAEVKFYTHIAKEWVDSLTEVVYEEEKEQEQEQEQEELDEVLDPVLESTPTKKRRPSN